MPGGKKSPRPARAPRSDDWIVLAGRFRERGPAPEGPPSDLWAAAVYATDGRTLGHAMDVRRDKAVRRAVGDALAAHRPGRVFAEPSLLDTGLLGRLGLPATAVEPGHAPLVAGFAALLDEYGALAAEEDGELDEVAATAEFLDAAALALSALDVDRELAPIAELHPPRGDVRVALVRTGPDPAVITAAPDDVGILMRELSAGEPPTVATLAVAFLPEDELDADTRTAMRDAGWSAALLPVVRATAPDRGAVEASPAALRDLADILRTLVAAGVARAGRGELAAGTVEVDWPGGGHAFVTWHVEDAGDEQAHLH